MKASVRRSEILQELAEAGSVTVIDLAERFAVSAMTIRRDLESLAERGLLSKVHGGATALTDHSTHEPGFDVKSSRLLAEKDAIARHAASLVRSGSAIGILRPSMTNVPVESTPAASR